MKYILSLSFLFFGLNINAQNNETAQSVLKKANKSLNKVDNMTYYIKYNYKSFNSEDTIKLQGEVVMERNQNKKYSKDIYFYLKGEELKDGNIIGVTNRKSDGLFYQSEYLNHEDGTVMKRVYNLDDTDKKVMHANVMDDLVLHDYFKKKNIGFYNTLLASILISSKYLEDVEFNGESCYKVILDLKDRSSLKDGMVNLYIRKSDYMPIGYMSTSKFQNMTDYTFYTLEYKKINDNQLTLDYFTVDTQNVDFDKFGEVLKREDKLSDKEQEQAPHFITKSFDEQGIDLNDYKGKVVVLDFWYRGCLPCLKAIPDLIAINEQYKEKDFAIIGINYNDTQKQVSEFVAYKEINYTSSFSSGDIVEQYGVTAFPTTIVIDQSGKIHTIMTGWDRSYKRYLTKVIDGLLK